MTWNRHLAGASFYAILVFLAPVALLAQAPASALQAQFNQERDAVRKARLLPKLGDEQFRVLTAQAQAGGYAEALETLKSYRDNVAAAHAALKSSGVNAEKKPNGFKQLQMHVRKSLRVLEHITMTLPVDQREPFVAIRDELSKINDELIELLFPRRPKQSSVGARHLNG